MTRIAVLALFAFTGVAAAMPTQAGMGALDSVTQADGPAPPAGARLEAVSIKPNPGGGLGRQSVQMDPNHLSYVNLRLSNLLMAAFALKPYQLEAPDWADSVSFDVNATFSGAKDSKNLILLLQPVLIERFKLSFHRTTRDRPVYELVVAPGAPKITPSGAPQSNATQTGADGYHLQAVMTLPDLASLIGGQTDRPVFDRTGLTGNYGIKLDFIPESMRLQADAAQGPGIVTALQEQLGLKLQSATGPVEYFVVDHLERAPGGN